MPTSVITNNFFNIKENISVERNTKKAWASLLLIGFLLLIPFFEGKAQVAYKIDSLESSIFWKGRGLKTTQNGTIKIKKGEINISEDDVTGFLTIDMTTLSCTDSMSGEWIYLLEGHLKSKEFFNVEEYPEARLDLIAADQLMDVDGNPIGYDVLAHLTIKGINESVGFRIKIQYDGANININGRTTMDRTRWAIYYGSKKYFPSIGEKLIDDFVELRFEMVGRAM